MAGASEQGTGRERLGISVGTQFIETGRHSTAFTVEKWDRDQIHWAVSKDYDGLRLLSPGAEPTAVHFRTYRCLPFETFTEEDCNLIVSGGWQYIMNGIAGSAIQKFTNGTRGRIGGGDTGGATAVGDSDMKAAINASNRRWEVINAIPTVGASGAAGLILAAQFGTAVGNFAWAEFATDNGTAGGADAAAAPMISRGVATPGTKTAAQTWNATVTITWT
jgi:hypothetical protein